MKINTTETNYLTGDIDANLGMREMKAQATEILKNGPLYTNASVIARMARAKYDFTNATIIFTGRVSERIVDVATANIVASGAENFVLISDRDL